MAARQPATGSGVGGGDGGLPQGTRERILDVSLRLFTEQATTAPPCVRSPTSWA